MSAIRRLLYDASCEVIGMTVGVLLGVASVIAIKLQGRR